MALVDADYQFRWLDVGATGGMYDAGIFLESELRLALEGETLPIPDPEPLPTDTEAMPYFFLGDDAFPLKSWLMKPYSNRDLTRKQRVYNYRISRGRRIVENAFGILAGCWQVLHRCIQLDVQTTTKLIMACCTLHNMMMQENPTDVVAAADREDVNHHVVPGSWRRGIHKLRPLTIERGNKAGQAAQSQRNVLKHYFCGPAGSVPWQDDHLLDY